ncbi:MAG: hypothetical protein WCZ43_13360, partial [Proteiniphilum sp.]
IPKEYILKTDFAIFPVILRLAIQLYHFTETVHDNEIYFDYKIKKGILTTRNAISILELNGYPDELINDAKNIARLLQS